MHLFKNAAPFCHLMKDNTFKCPFLLNTIDKTKHLPKYKETVIQKVMGVCNRIWLKVQFKALIDKCRMNHS